MVEFGMTKDCGLLVNSSRGIIYAGKDENFGARAAEESKKIQEDMESHLRNHGIIG